MATKVEAAADRLQRRRAGRVAAAAQAAAALAGEQVGTLFAPTGRRPSARQFWLRHASRPRGRLLLDDGAVRAVLQRHASLLAAGITGVAGEFEAGDPVELIGPDGSSSRAGWSPTTPASCPPLLGRKTGDLTPEYRREVVHRDEMVLVGPRPWYRRLTGCTGDDPPHPRNR